MKYGRLMVLETYFKRLPNGKRATFAMCRCECGTEKEVQMNSLKTGNTKSCGCLSRDVLVERNTVHGQRFHPAYDTYNGMMARCYNKNKSGYPHYGGRGIKVAEEWHDIKNFLNWCENNGFEPDLQLDRIDNEKDYSPSNCRFVTQTVNLRNTRRNVMINGMALREYLDILGEKHKIGFPTLRYRYYTIKKEGLEPTEYNLIQNERWLNKR